MNYIHKKTKNNQIICASINLEYIDFTFAVE